MNRTSFRMRILPLAVAAAVLHGCGGGGAGGSNSDLYAENMLVDAGTNVAAAPGSKVSLLGEAKNENRMIQSMNWVIKTVPEDAKMVVQMEGGSCVFGTQRETTPPSGNGSTGGSAPSGDIPGGVMPGGGLIAPTSYDWKDTKTCPATLFVGNVPTAQDIVLMLTAVDSEGHSQSDEMTVSISPNTNSLVVDAGPDVNVGAATKLTLPCRYTGGFWYDNAQPKPVYRWYVKNAPELQLAGVSLTLNWDTATGSLTMDTPDNLTRDLDAQLACEVTDESGVVAEDVMVVHMKALDPLIANAGPMQTVKPNTTVTLDASGTTDPKNTGNPIYYRWSQLSGPTVNLINSDAQKASFVAPNVTAATDLMFQVSVSREPITSSTVFATSEQAETVVRVTLVSPLVASAGPAQTV
ncbi:MAG: hypothetical protein K6346_08215, partial [Halothiobacillaceae bacterium]